MHPAHYNSFAALVLGAQFAAIVCAFQVAEKIEHVVSSSRGTGFSLCSVWFSLFQLEFDGRVLQSCKWLAQAKACATTASAENPTIEARSVFAACHRRGFSASTRRSRLHYRRESARSERPICLPGRGLCRISAPPEVAQR